VVGSDVDGSSLGLVVLGSIVGTIVDGKLLGLVVGLRVGIKLGLVVGTLIGRAVGPNVGVLGSWLKQICHPVLLTLPSVLHVNTCPVDIILGACSRDSTSVLLIIK
jgi:hypothetical protein